MLFRSAAFKNFTEFVHLLLSLIRGAKRLLIVVDLLADGVESFLLRLFHHFLIGLFADDRFAQRTAGSGRICQIDQRLLVLNQRRPRIFHLVVALFDNRVGVVDG